MNRYPKPTHEKNIWSFLTWSAKLHYLTLTYTFLCIIAIVLSKYLLLYLTTTSLNLYWTLAIQCLLLVVVIYFFSIALLATSESFSYATKSFSSVMYTVFRRAVPIYGTFLLYIVGAWIIYHLCDYIIIVLDKYIYGHATTVTMRGSTLMIASAVVLVFLGMFFFSYPIAVISDKSIRQAFSQSIVLSEKNKLGILFLVFIVAASILLLEPSRIHLYLLELYHLEALYDFVILSITVPLFINLLLYLINDSENQIRME